MNVRSHFGSSHFGSSHFLFEPCIARACKEVVWFSFASSKTTRDGSQEMGVHGRAFRVGANLARSALPISSVAQSRCAAQASATCTSGDRIRAPSAASVWRQSSAIPRSSRQQVTRRCQEVCIFQGGASSGSHCQFGRRRSGEVIFAAGSQTRPATDCSSTWRSTYRRLRSVHRACEEAGPECRSTREESGGGTAPPRRRACRCRATFGRPPARSCKGRGCSLHISKSTWNASGDCPANSSQQDPPPEWASEIQRLRTEVARFKASRPVRDSVEAAQNVRAKAEKRRAGFMDDMPTDEQNLRSWLEDKNLEMRDALDVGDTEADQMRASCRQKCQTKSFGLVQPLDWGGSHPIERGAHVQMHSQVWASRHTCWGSRTPWPNPPTEKGCGCTERGTWSLDCPHRQPLSIAAILMTRCLSCADQLDLRMDWSTIWRVMFPCL